MFTNGEADVVSTCRLVLIIQALALAIATSSHHRPSLYFRITFITTF